MKSQCDETFLRTANTATSFKKPGTENETLWLKVNGYLIDLVLNWLKTQKIPQHVAFIMDGNRRYAKGKGLDKIQGHTSGFQRLLNILEWCLKLDVKVVTIYAFSIENFNRPKAEVNALMSLAEEKFKEFVQNESIVMQYGIRVRIIGDLSLLPEGVKNAAAQVMIKTMKNTGPILNIGFPYSSKEEIVRITRETVAAIRSGKLRNEDISYPLLSRCCYTRGCDPELLIRTSGETRLSDFMIWQSRFTFFRFIPVLWPDLTIWHLVRCILDYQNVADVLSRQRVEAMNAFTPTAVSLQRQNQYIEELDRKNEDMIKGWLISD